MASQRIERETPEPQPQDIGTLVENGFTSLASIIDNKGRNNQELIDKNHELAEALLAYRDSRAALFKGVEDKRKGRHDSDSEMITWSREFDDMDVIDRLEIHTIRTRIGQPDQPVTARFKYAPAMGYFNRELNELNVILMPGEMHSGEYPIIYEVKFGGSKIKSISREVFLLASERDLVGFPIESPIVGDLRTLTFERQNSSLRL